jgi:hypothetical protein
MRHQISALCPSLAMLGMASATQPATEPRDNGLCMPAIQHSRMEAEPQLK